MAEYLLILHGNLNNWNSLPKSQQGEIMARYGAYAKKLAGAGKLKGGDACQDGSYWLSPGPQGVAVDGPRRGEKNAVTGWFHLEAGTVEEALALAKECPALSHGDSVELVILGHD